MGRFHSKHILTDCLTSKKNGREEGFDFVEIFSGPKAPLTDNEDRDFAGGACTSMYMYVHVCTCM